MTAQRHRDPAFHEPLLLRPSRRAAAASASVSPILSSQRLRSQLIESGHTALTDADLLWLLLSRSRHTDDPHAAVTRLLHVFGTVPRVLAARPDRLRTLASLSDDAIAAVKTAEALAIRQSRASVPRTVRPTLPCYDAVIDYCRALAGHRETEAFHLLFLDNKNTLIADELQQQGTVNHTPVYVREVCIRSLELQASSIIALHNHPSGDPEPSNPDIDMTRQLKTALKTIGVTLLDHIIVTSGSSISFHTRGLL